LYVLEETAESGLSGDIVVLHHLDKLGALAVHGHIDAI